MGAGRPGDGPVADPTATRWIAGAGAFVIMLDSLMNVAFPAIAAAFARPPEAMRWVIIPYVGSYAVMSFAGGALGDRVGHARVFRAGLAGSALAFAAGAVAPAFGWLVLARVLQGVAGGLVFGTAPGMLTAIAAPAARGRAVGFFNAAIGLAATLGPLVAGGLVAAGGWRAVFAVRVPIALVVLAWAWGGLRAAPPVAPARRLRVRDVARGDVIAPSLLSFVANGGIFAIWLLAPFYLVEVRGLGAGAGGALFMLTPLGTTVAAPVAGRLADRLGARAPMVAGLALEALALAALAGAGPGTAVPWLATGLFGAGFGLGAFQVPNMSAVMAQFPAGQQGAAGGLSFMARTLGVVGGVAVLAEVFARRREAAGFDAAFLTAFVSAAAAVGAAALAAAVSGRAARRRL